MSVPPAEEHYDIDEFNDLYAKTKPTLYIKMADIFSIHQLITTELPHVCPSQDDVLRDIIRELGSVKSNENELMSVSSNEISLTLNPKLHNAEGSLPSPWISRLPLTKRQIRTLRSKHSSPRPNGASCT